MALGLKGLLLDNIVQPIARDNESFTTVAKVTDSDEVNNVCSIQYVDRAGHKRNKDNVVVRLYDTGSGYFPKIGEDVEVQLDRDTCVIIARHIGNYNTDVRAKMMLGQDVYSDNPGNTPGSSIF